MDSVTQFVLGSTIGGVVLGRKLGAPALLIGGIAGTLPDLDSFVMMGNMLDNMTYHRGASHSLFVLTLAAPVVAYAMSRVYKPARDCFKELWLAVWLVLITHPLLDSLTTYGTQLYWPFTDASPAAFPSVFIIDPLYTVPLIVGTLAMWLWRKKPQKALRWGGTALAISTIYLGLGMAAHLTVRAQAEALPALAGKRVHVQPLPFNIFYWQVLAIDDSSYYQGYTSPFSQCETFGLRQSPRLATAPEGFQTDTSIQRLEWQTDGFYSYALDERGLAIRDLRIGAEDAFVFNFHIADRQNGKLTLVDPIQEPTGERSLAVLKTFFPKMQQQVASCG
ncbi:metal-dependent hydrolase [Rhodovibrionaceae bacterium A322]